MKGIGKFLQKQVENFGDLGKRAQGRVTDQDTRGSTSSAAEEQRDSEETRLNQDEVDPVLEHLLLRVRSQQVRNHVLKAPREKYVNQHEIRLQALTYNVNGRKPTPDMSLSRWLEPGSGDVMTDIIAIGFQELVPLHAGNVLTGGEDPASAGAWISLIDKTLNPNRGIHQSDAAQPTSQSVDYFLIASQQLVGVFLTVWAHKRVLPHIRGIQVTSVSTGFGGFLGNKGSVAVRMRVYDTGICWMCVHLASGEGQAACERRIQDVTEICRRLEFPAVSRNLNTQGGGRLIVGHGRDGNWGGTDFAAPGHECVVLMGDLNFRVTMSQGEAMTLIRAGRLPELLSHDELRKCCQTEPAMQPWREGPFDFHPTFKFRPGSDEYSGAVVKSFEDADVPEDDEKEEKIRTPSWTDRVLWQSRAGNPLHQLAYTSGPQTLSDHRPVAAAFLLYADEYLGDAVEALLEEGWRALDLVEMSAMPKCELEPRSIDFGDVEYATEAKHVMSLRNTGSIAAHFRFVESPGLMVDSITPSASSVAPRWLAIDPLEGVVEAGATAEISLSVTVEGGPDGCAHMVQEELKGELDVILVLHIAGGSDFFISLNGHYVGSCYGLPLRDLDIPYILNQDTDAPPSGSARTVLTTPHLELRVPSVVLRLTKYLLRDERLATPFIFLEQSPAGTQDTALDRHILAVRRSLDSGAPLPEDAEPLAVAACLVDLFVAMPIPLMPEPIVKMCEMCNPSAHTAVKLVKDNLGKVEYATFCHLTALMRHALSPQFTATSHLTVESVSSLLASVWFPLLPERLSLLGESTGTALDVLQGFAENASCIDLNRAEFLRHFLSPDFEEEFGDDMGDSLHSSELTGRGALDSKSA